MTIERYSSAPGLSTGATRSGPWRVLVPLALASAPLYAAGFHLAPELPPTQVFPFLHAPLFALYLAAVAWVWRRPGVPIPLILACAIAFRLLTTLDPPALSSDCHRYAWDGRVQRAGFSPYAWPPEAPELAELRDARIYPEINRKAERTVYPPGAQALYLALPFDVGGLRTAMILFDLATMALLARLLAVCGRDPGRVILYAWCPLVVYEVGNNGHVEAMMLPFLVGAVLAWRAGRWSASGLLVGAAASMKLYPALAFVALARHRAGRVVGAGLGLVAALYAVYAWPVGSGVLGFLPRYFGSAEDHNIGLRRAIEAVLPAGVPHPREVAFAACVALLLGGLAWVRRQGGAPELQLLRITGLYLLTLPSAFHPWYALWLVPWLCFHPRFGWLWLLGALPLSYLKYGAPGEVMPSWVVPLELLPAVGLLAAERAWRVW